MDDSGINIAKRKRAPNFSEEEESRLLELVTRYKHVVECRKTDTVNNRIKNETWDLITAEFNMKSSDRPRTVQNLRAKYENIKKAMKESYAESNVAHLNEAEEDILIEVTEKYQVYFAQKNIDVPGSIWQQICCEFNDRVKVKRNMAFLRGEFDRIRKKGKEKLTNDKKEITKTGGGRFEKAKLSSNEERVQALLGERLTGFQSSFDSDCCQKKRTSGDGEQDYTFPNKKLERGASPSSLSRFDDSEAWTSEIVIHDEDNIEQNSGCRDKNREILGNNGADWSQYNPAQLKTQKSVLLSQHRSQPPKPTEPARFDDSEAWTSEIVIHDEDNIEQNSGCRDKNREILGNNGADWSQYNPAQLKTQKSVLLSQHRSQPPKPTEPGASKRNQAKDKITMWAKSKLDLAELQKRAFLEEHELKMKIMRDKAAKRNRNNRKRIKAANGNYDVAKTEIVK